MNDELAAIFDRIANGRFTEADMASLRQFLESGDREVKAQFAKFNVNIGDGKDIQIGDRIYQQWNKDAMEALIKAIKETGSINQVNQGRDAAGRDIDKRDTYENCTFNTFIAVESLAKGSESLSISPEVSELTATISREINTSASPKIYSALLAPDFPDFWGRIKELEILLENFKTSRIILIDGEPGVGKTYVAAKFAQQLPNDYKTLWIDKENLTLEELMFYVNKALVADDHHGFVDTYDNERLNTEEKIPAFIDVIGSSNVPKYAIFIDAYERINKSELKLFIERFSSHGGESKLILISNLALALGVSLIKKIVRHTIRGFQDQEGIDYITKCTLDRDLIWQSKDINLVLLKTLGHPMTINLIIQCCTEIRTPSQRVLDNLLKYDKQFGGELYRKLLKNIEDLLNDEEKKAMYRLAVFRKPVHFSTWNILGVSENIGESLLLKRLLTPVDKDKFQMYPLIRQFWWESLQSEEERCFSHEKSGHYYWNKAQESLEGWISGNQDSLNFDLYLESYYHFNEISQQELATQIIEELIRATHTQERCLLELSNTYLPELDDSLGIDKPWIVMEKARQYEKKATFASLKKAEELFSQSYNIFIGKGDKLGAALALYYKGKILHVNNQPLDALSVLKSVLELAKEMNDISMQIRTLAKLISIYIDLNQYDDAEKVADLAEISAHKIGDRLGKALITYRKGSIKRQCSKFEEAEKYFIDSAEAYKSLGDRYRASKSLSRLGFTQHKLGKFHDAISNLEMSIKIKESLADEYGLALDMDYLGDVYRSQGLHKEAKDYYQKSLVIKEERGDIYGVVKSFNNLGRNSLLAGYLDEVQDFLVKSKENLQLLKQKSGKYRGLEGAYLTIKGDYHLKTREYRHAIDSYNAAKDCFVPNQYSYARALFGLGRIYIEIRDFQKSRDLLNESLKLFNKSSTRYNQALTLNYLAKLESYDGNFTDAKNFLENAIHIAKEIEAKDILSSCNITTVLFDILRYYSLDTPNFLSNNSSRTARLLVLSGHIEEAALENEKTVTICENTELHDEIMAIYSETRGVIEEGDTLLKFCYEYTKDAKDLNKIKEKLINKVWKEYDKALQGYIIKQLVPDIARVRTKKNLWRLMVKLLLDEMPIITEEDYNSVESLEVSFSQNFIQEVMWQEILSVKYFLLISSSKTDRILIERRAKYFLKILSPLVQRLNFKIDIAQEEELAFKMLYPDEFKYIKDFLSNIFINQDNFAYNVAQELKRRLNDFKIDAEVIYRNKSPYSIYRKKTERKGVTLDKILDFVAFRVITKNVKDCYTSLDIIDDMGSRFTGIPLRDYIKIPKQSGYQSIHVNIEILPDAKLYGELRPHIVEFQIRTQLMHDNAEMGEKAHSYYKDVLRYSKPNTTKDFKGSQEIIIECQRSLIGDIGRIIRSQEFEITSVDLKTITDQIILIRLELRIREPKISSVNEKSVLSSLIHSLKSLHSDENDSAIRSCNAFILDKQSSEPSISALELSLDERNNILQELVSNFSSLRDHVYVLTPGGDVEILSTGSTPIDFAYKVHTDVGNQCCEAKVNGKRVPLNTPLKNGDTVEIITKKTSHPKEEWLRMPKNPEVEHPFISSSSTRHKIRNWFKKKSYEQNISIGKDLLEQEIGKISQKPEIMMLVANELNYPNIEVFLAALGYGQVTLQKAINVINGVKFELGRRLLISEIGKPNVDALEKINFYVDISSQNSCKSFQDFLILLGNNKNLLDSQLLKKLKDRISQLNIEELGTKDLEKPDGDRVLALIDEKYIRWVIGGVENLRYRFASCCKIYPCEDNIGIVKRASANLGAGILIHNQLCQNLRNASESHFVEISNAVHLKIKTFDRIGIEGEISTLLAEQKLNIREGSVKTFPNKEALFTKSITIANSQDMKRLHDTLPIIRRIEGVKEVDYIEKKLTLLKDGRITYFEEK